MCDQPHPLLVASVLGQCAEGRLEDAHDAMEGLWQKGKHSATAFNPVSTSALGYRDPWQADPRRAGQGGFVV